MNKLFFCGVALAALTLAGCSNDEVVQSPVTAEKAISFADAFIGKLTKTDAVDPTAESLNNLLEISVYGYQGTDKLFDNQKVTRESSTAEWTYSPLKYWADGKSYTFVALGNFGVDADSNTLADGTITTVVKGFISDGKTDALASNLAKAENVDIERTDPVKFDLNHVLSKVKFTFENGFGETDDVTLQVTDVKITDAYATGNVSIVAGTDFEATWSDQGIDTLSLEFGDTQKITSAAVTGEGYVQTKDVAANERLLIPSPDTKDYTVTFTVHVLANAGTDNEFEMTTYDHTATISGAAFEPGYAYNLLAAINASNVNPEKEAKPITFTVNSIVDWNDAEDDVEFPAEEE